MSPDFPYASLVNSMEIDLCSASKRDLFMFRQLLQASDLPPTCPIPAGTYTIQSFHLDLGRYPLLLRGFDSTAEITVHNGDHIYGKIDARWIVAWFQRFVCLLCMCFSKQINTLWQYFEQNECDLLTYHLRKNCRGGIYLLVYLRNTLKDI